MKLGERMEKGRGKRRGGGVEGKEDKEKEKLYIM